MEKLHRLLKFLEDRLPKLERRRMHSRRNFKHQDCLPRLRLEGLKLRFLLLPRHSRKFFIGLKQCTTWKWNGSCELNSDDIYSLFQSLDDEILRAADVYLAICRCEMIREVVRDTAPEYRSAPGIPAAAQVTADHGDLGLEPREEIRIIC